MPSPSPRWSIGLAAWIIQDGNYGNFSVGDRAEFALEFYPAGDIDLVADAAPSATHVRECQYDVVGRVVHVDERSWVLDIGLLTYLYGPTPDGVVPGQTLRTSLHLGIDPFMYLERLRHDPNYPDMVYTWDVQAIRRETAPYVLNRNVWVRDQTKLGRIEVPETDAWNDDGGHGDYLFDCDLVPVPPKRSSVTAV